LHWKLEPGSVEVKPKLAEALFVKALGLLSIFVSGAVVSTIQVVEAGEASVLPAPSVALTSRVCDPSERSV
jgi:hypothetical protein